MTDFDPKWPHGWVAADGRKVTELRPRPGHTVVLEDGSFWQINSFGHVEPGCGVNILNAPAPKRKVPMPPPLPSDLEPYDVCEVCGAKFATPEDVDVCGRPGCPMAHDIRDDLDEEESAP